MNEEEIDALEENARKYPSGPTRIVIEKDWLALIVQAREANRRTEQVNAMCAALGMRVTDGMDYDPVAWCRSHVAEAARLHAERDKLQAFKQWVHQFLDAHGVPHHPPGTHGAEGCRIGDRMDWLVGRVKERDIEWWQACCLVDNVAPTPETVKDWLMTLSAYEQQELKDDNARLRACVAALEQAAQPFAIEACPEQEPKAACCCAYCNLRRVLEDKG